jgi:cell division protein DivIC
MKGHLHIVENKMLRLVPRRLRNRYGATAIAMTVYLLAFHDYDVFTMVKLRYSLYRTEQAKTQYARDIQLAQDQLAELNGNQALLEKFARERYLMKRADEEVFIMVEKP